MSINPDFFMAQGDPMNVHAAPQAGCNTGFPDFIPFPGCVPGSVTSQWQPYTGSSSFSSTFVEWFFPYTVETEQFIGCNFKDNQYGPQESDKGSSLQLYVGNQLKATKIWDSTDRTRDRGFVWDISILIPAQIPVRIQGQQWRRSNTEIDNNTLAYLTGTFFRDY